MENDITVIFVSFHSEDIIEKSIATINHNIPIIVIENSRNFTFKEKLEKKYSNIKVIIPDENLGNGAGINRGIKNIKTKYVFYLDVDTELFPDTMDNFFKIAEENLEFAMIQPNTLQDKNKFENYNLDSKSKVWSHNIELDQRLIKTVRGHALFLNLQKPLKLSR